MRKRLKLTRIAEKITGQKAREVTTNYVYWVKRSIRKTGNYPRKFLDKILFYFFVITTYVFYFTPTINKQGIIYIPFCFLYSENLAIRCLVHEINHYKFPKASEEEIRFISKDELSSWKKSLMR
jgi:hypothetical protein